MFGYRFRVTCLPFLVLPLFIAGTIQSASAKSDKRETEVEKAWVNLLGDNAKERWRGYKEEGWPKGWKVEDGVLSRFEGGSDIMTVAKYADFELQLEWKISEGGNSGIMYRVRTGDKAPYFTGPEYQVLDNKRHADGASTLTSSGSLYGLYAPAKDWTKPIGEWNKTRIVVRGKHVRHWLNGRNTVNCKIDSDDWNERLEKSKFKEWEQFAKISTGHIALQDHGDLVWYRKVRVRTLSAEKTRWP